MSNYLSRNSKMPDVSLQPRENFTLKQIVVAFVLVVVIVGIGTALAVAFNSNREQVLQTAINEAKAEKSLPAKLNLTPENARSIIAKPNSRPLRLLSRKEKPT